MLHINKILLLLFTFFAFSLSVFAQKVITGVVTTPESPDGEYGVAVSPKGNALKGVLTDFEGNFKLTLQDNENILLVRFTGFETQEVNIAGKTTIRIKLKPSIKILDEVIVKGYFTEKKQDNVGSVAKVSGADIAATPAPSFEAGLQGRASGVQITQSSGVAGSAVSVKIRGTGSVSAGSEPLYIIDGIPVTSGSAGDGGGGVGGAVNAGFQLNPLASINQNDIESIEVLKDANATAIYGARGSNGVILITTRRGKAGKTKFNVSTTTGQMEVTNRLKLTNTPQYMELLREGYKNSFYTNPDNSAKAVPKMDNYLTFPLLSLTSDGIDSSLASKVNTDWLDLLLRQGGKKDVSVSASGGSQKFKFFGSGTYSQTKGPMIGNDYQKFATRFNLDNQISQRLSLGLSTSLNYTINNIVPAGSSSQAQGGFGVAQTRSLPFFPVYWNQVDPRPNTNAFNPYYNAYNNNFGGTNIALTQNRDYNSIKRQEYRIISGVNLEYKINEFLTYRTDAGIDYFSTVEDLYSSRYVRLASANVAVRQPASLSNDSRVEISSYNFNNVLNFVKDLDKKGDHNLAATAGISYQDWSSSNNSTSSEVFPNDFTKNVSSGSYTTSRSSNFNQFRTDGYFLRGNYKFKKRYIFNYTSRVDGNSRFGKNNRYGFFPSVAAGWLVHEEAFMKDTSFRLAKIAQKISTLKVRASYGRAGNAALGGNYLPAGLYTPGSSYNQYPGSAPKQINNPDLTWEKSLQFDASVDLGFLNDKFYVTATYFNKYSYDMLIAQPLAPSSGLQSNSLTRNIGEMTNQGWEFTLSTKNIDKMDDNRKWKFKWTTDFNLTRIRNKVNSIGGLKPSELTGGVNTQVFINEQIGTLFLPKWGGVDPNTGKEIIYNTDGSVKNYDFFTNQAQAIAFMDSLRIAMPDKPTLPKYYAGITNNFELNGFNLSFMWYFNVGNWILDEGARQQSYVTGANNLRENIYNDRWQKPGDQTDVPKVYYNAINNDFKYQSPFATRATSRFLQDGSYVRLRNVTLGYTFSEKSFAWYDKLGQSYRGILKKSGINQIKLYVQLFNYLTFTKFKGWDPEVVSNQESAQNRNLNPGITNLDFPQVKQLIFGVNVSF